MMQTLTRKIWTDEALEALPKERGKFELIDGKLTRMSPARRDHGAYEVRISAALSAHVQPRRLGIVFAASAGFRLDEENVLSPDVAYSSKETLRRDPLESSAFGSLPPDLAVEIISPSERRPKIQRKREKYFARGTRLVWLVYPRRKEVEVYTSPTSMTLKGIGDDLDGGDLLPGFRLSLAELFEEWF